MKKFIIALSMIILLSQFVLTCPAVASSSAITIDIGVPNGSPMFNLSNMKPGDMQAHDVIVTNSSNNPVFIIVKSNRTSPATNPPLENAFDITVTSGGQVIYTDSLANFFSDSLRENSIRLGKLPANTTLPYHIVITFRRSAGNEFENRTLTFDINFGTLNASITNASNSTQQDNSQSVLEKLTTKILEFIEQL